MHTDSATGPTGQHEWTTSVDKEMRSGHHHQVRGSRLHAYYLIYSVENQQAAARGESLSFCAAHEQRVKSATCLTEQE